MGKLDALTASVQKQAALLRKVNAEVETARPGPRVAANDGR